MDPDRQTGALLIAAPIVAAIRLRGEPINNSPRTVSTVQDAIKLARMVLQADSAEMHIISR